MPELHAPYIRAVAAALQDAGVHVADYFSYTDNRGLMKAEMIIAPGPDADRSSARRLFWGPEFGWQIGPQGLRYGAVHRSHDALPSPADQASEARNVINNADHEKVIRDVDALRSSDSDDDFLTRLAAYARPDDPEDAPGRGFLPPGDRVNAIPGKGETRHLSSAARTAAVWIGTGGTSWTGGRSWLISEAWPEAGGWKAFALRMIPDPDTEDPGKWHEVRLADFERVHAARLLGWKPVPVWQTQAHGMWGNVVPGLRDEKQAARMLAGFPAWAAFNGIDATAEARETARRMVLSRFPGADDTIYTVDVPSVSTYELRVRGGGESEAREVAAALDSIDLNPVSVTSGAFIPDVEATIEPTSISVWGPASFVHAYTVDGRSVGITEDPPAEVPQIPAGSVILDPDTVSLLASELRAAHRAMDPDNGTNDDEHDALAGLTEILADIIPVSALAEPAPEPVSSSMQVAVRPAPLEAGPGSAASPAAAGRPGHSKRPAARPDWRGTGRRRDGGQAL